MERLFVLAEGRFKKVKRINKLLKSSMRTPFEGIGKPECLIGDLQVYWSEGLILNMVRRSKNY
jgi:Txe/YoeB family toxin of Txe-Axe toxin-antitoxin module